MKKITFIILTFSFLSCNLTDKQTIDYYHKVTNELNLWTDIIQEDFDIFYAKYGFYPVSFQEFMDSIVGLNGDIDGYKGLKMRDPFLLKENLFDMCEYGEGECFKYRRSINDSLLLRYYPIYEKIDKKPVSFVLLSVGEDEQINSNVNEPLYIHNWHKQIKAYNEKWVISALEKRSVAYPFYFPKSNYISYAVFHFDEQNIDFNKIPLQGDSIFGYRDFLKFQDSLKTYTDSSSFYYPKHSQWRAMFGKKDYIVAFGREIIKYEIQE